MTTAPGALSQLIRFHPDYTTGDMRAWLMKELQEALLEYLSTKSKQ
jgi:hypothetical protein